MRSIVLDTNVLVAGLLTPFNAPGRVLDAVLAGQVRLLYDDRILAEYGDGQAVVAPPLGIALPDPDGAMFVEVAVAGRAEAIVTGNPRPFPPTRAMGSPSCRPASSWTGCAPPPAPDCRLAVAEPHPRAGAPRTASQRRALPSGYPWPPISEPLPASGAKG